MRVQTAIPTSPMRRLACLAIMMVGALALVGCSQGPQPRTDNLDPQMSWPYNPERLAGQEGKFYINGESEGYVTVFDAQTRDKLKVISVWDYEIAQLKAAGKPADDKALDFIQKNAKPHHSWIVPGGRYNYISNNSGGWDRFWVVDTRTDEIVSHMNTGGNGPLHGAFSPYRDLAIFDAVQDKEQGVASFINTKTHQVIGKVIVPGTQTRDVVFTPDNKHAYITSSGYDEKSGNLGGVTMMDIDKMSVVKSFDMPGARAMKMSYDGKMAAVASIKKQIIYFINMETHEVVGQVAVGKDPNNVAFHPDGTRLYVGIRKDKVFAVIDIATFTVKTTIAAGKDANAVYFPPGNSKVAIATNEADDFVTVIDTVNDVKIKDIPTPLGAHNVAYTPDGRVAIVSCRKSREAVFIDVQTMEEIGVISDAGHGNNGVRWAPYTGGNNSKTPYAMK